MATHSSVLAWRIPGTEEPSGLPSMGSHRAGHDWSDLAAATHIIRDILILNSFQCTILNCNTIMNCSDIYSRLIKLRLITVSSQNSEKLRYAISYSEGRTEGSEGLPTPVCDGQPGSRSKQGWCIGATERQQWDWVLVNKDFTHSGSWFGQLEALQCFQ